MSDRGGVYRSWSGTGKAGLAERRHARYHISIPLRPVSPVTLDERGEFV
jgi:predicted nucleotidyltransferase